MKRKTPLLFLSNNILLHHLISSHPHMFFKIGVLKNFADFRGKHLCSSLFLTQVVSCQISKIFKNNFFKEHLGWLLRYMLYTHGVTCNLSRWNNRYNGNYKKDKKKLKHFENIEINFTFPVTMCIYINTEYWPEYSFKCLFSMEYTKLSWALL